MLMWYNYTTYINPYTPNKYYSIEAHVNHIKLYDFQYVYHAHDPENALITIDFYKKNYADDLICLAYKFNPDNFSTFGTFINVLGVSFRPQDQQISFNSRDQFFAFMTSHYSAKVA